MNQISTISNSTTTQRPDEDEWVITDESTPRPTSSASDPSQSGCIDDDPSAVTKTGIEDESEAQSDDINSLWIHRLFPDKTAEKRQHWLTVLRSNEFDKISHLVALDSAG